jgi:hypothetical protein
MAKDKKGSEISVHMKAVANKYLVDGERIIWQGKPATIVIIGRGVLITALSIVLLIFMWLWHDWMSIAIALVACLLMMITDKRYGLIIGLVGVIVIVLVEVLGTNWLLGLPLALSLFYLMVNIIYLGRVLFMITDQRIITRYGIISLRYAELDIERIQNITVIQPWYERMLGFGDVYFATSGEKGGIDYQRPGIKLMSGGAVTWENVGKPFDVVRKVNEIIHPIDQIKKEGGAVHPLGQNDAEERLRQLSDLSVKGLISQQEYQQKREELLKKL